MCAKLKLGVCTVNAQYVMAERIKEVFYSR